MDADIFQFRAGGKNFLSFFGTKKNNFWPYFFKVCVKYSGLKYTFNNEKLFLYDDTGAGN
jgi:hypothetical protein